MTRLVGTAIHFLSAGPGGSHYLTLPFSVYNYTPEELDLPHTTS